MNSSSGASAVPVEPAYLWVPPRIGTLGDNVVDLMAMFGLELDEHQTAAVDAICSVKSEDPLWAALEAAIIEPRQNGKSIGVLLPVAIHGALRKPDQLVVWSAHRYKTAREAFLAMLKLYRNSPRFAAKVQRVVYSNGEEAFEFKNGSRIVFVARSQASGRGLSGDLVILDEALFLTAEMMGALFPTLSARPDPLVVYASSAGIVDSIVLRGIRDRGRPGGDPSLVWIEYCSTATCEFERCQHELGTPGCALDNPDNWRAANPSERVSLDYIAAERRALPPMEFARERLGWWDEPDEQGRVIGATAWRDVLEAASTLQGVYYTAIDVEPDRSWSSVAVCGLNPAGKAHVEVARRDSGTAWVIPQLQRMGVERVYLNGAGAPASLQPDLERVGIQVEALNLRDLQKSCGAFYDAVMQERLVHIGQDPLDMALAGARKRESSGAWAWDRKDSTVVLADLVAVTLAHWSWLAATEAVPLVAFR